MDEKLKATIEGITSNQYNGERASLIVQILADIANSLASIDGKIKGGS